MNKILLLFVGLFLINFGYSQCQGDANLDSSTNIQDIVLIVNHVISDGQLTDDAFDNSDINNDDTIDVIDIVNIVNFILS